MKKGCATCSGKLVFDVTIRGRVVYCRRCGNEINLERVEEVTKQKIKDKIEGKK